MSRKKCTKSNPYTKKRDTVKSRWEHEEVEEIGEQQSHCYGGDTVKYRCKICGISWKAELPQ
jgi:hypothetical protein